MQEFSELTFCHCCSLRLSLSLSFLYYVMLFVRSLPKLLTFAGVFLLYLSQSVSAHLDQYFHFVSDSCIGYEGIIEEAYQQAIDIAIGARDLLLDPFQSPDSLELVRLLFVGDIPIDGRHRNPTSKVLQAQLEHRIKKPLCMFLNT